MNKQRLSGIVDCWFLNLLISWDSQFLVSKWSKKISSEQQLYFIREVRGNWLEPTDNIIAAVTLMTTLNCGEEKIVCIKRAADRSAERNYPVWGHGHTHEGFSGEPSPPVHVHLWAKRWFTEWLPLARPIAAWLPVDNFDPRCVTVPSVVWSQ